ncbi:MAG: hypothetical protein K2J15_06120, partial [Muribaculaceae bacterium]|nr:hypothetical protein [Muribaculaceae bacterium]
ENTALVITPYYPFSESGTYVFSIPGSDVIVDGYNYPVNFTYTINSGMSAVNIPAANQAADIYAIDGRIVARNASIDVIKTLNPGLYIINGKKVLVRK